MRVPAHALLPALGLLRRWPPGCAGDGAEREAGDPVTEAEAALLAGLLQRNHTEGGADFVVTAPYGARRVLTLTGEVDFRAGTGRAQAVTSSDGRTEEVRTRLLHPRGALVRRRPGLRGRWPRRRPGASYLRRPIAVDDERPPLVDVLVERAARTSRRGRADDPAAFVDAGYTLAGAAVDRQPADRAVRRCRRARRSPSPRPRTC